MSGVKLLSSLPLNQIRHAPGRPQPGTVTQHLGAFFQSATQLLQLGRQQSRLATGPTGFKQCAGSLFFPSLMPPTDRLPVNLQLSGYLALTQTPIKESSGLKPSPFQSIKITLNAFWITHAQRLPPKLTGVTILCETQ
jgi:hypothetical protein